MDLTPYVKDELRVLGITPKYCGYMQSILAVELILEDETRLLNITKEVYWKVADLCGCNRCDIERNLRTISRRAWKVNPARLEEIAGYPLASPPTASEFVTILATHIQRTYPQYAAPL